MADPVWPFNVLPGDSPGQDIEGLRQVPRIRKREAAVDVWLAEKAHGGPADVLGIYSRPEKAKKACQDSANEYFGERVTPLLHWMGDEGFCSASYHHPCTGMWLFTVTRYVVDEE